MVLGNLTGAKIIREKMYKQIQCFKRQVYSKKEIAAVLEMVPKTVAKYCRMDEWDFRSFRQQHLFRNKLFEEYEKTF